MVGFIQHQYPVISRNAASGMNGPDGALSALEKTLSYFFLFFFNFFFSFYTSTTDSIPPLILFPVSSHFTSPPVHSTEEGKASLGESTKSGMPT